MRPDETRFFDMIRSVLEDVAREGRHENATQALWALDQIERWYGELVALRSALKTVLRVGE